MKKIKVGMLERAKVGMEEERLEGSPWKASLRGHCLS